nr:unnamed protein product [Spirometra erinaceieuropaei]
MQQQSSQFPDRKRRNEETNKADANSGLRVFSVHLRRIRGLTLALNRISQLSYILETVGILSISPNESSTYKNFYFELQELENRPHPVRLKCLYSDIDGVNPDINVGDVYSTHLDRIDSIG